MWCLGRIRAALRLRSARWFSPRVARQAGEGFQTWRSLRRPDARAPYPSPVPPDRVISVGEEVRDALTRHGSHKAYELTAPSDGLLVAQLSWDTGSSSSPIPVADD